MWCVIVCDLETGSRWAVAREKKKNSFTTATRPGRERERVIFIKMASLTWMQTRGILTGSEIGDMTTIRACASVVKYVHSTNKLRGLLLRATRCINKNTGKEAGVEVLRKLSMLYTS
jgi:hypothetical protein